MKKLKNFDVADLLIYPFACLMAYLIGVFFWVIILKPIFQAFNICN